MNPPQKSINTNAVSGWEIRRAGKVYSVTSDELFLKIHREGRFTGSEEIRRRGNRHWYSISSVDFNELSKCALEPKRKTTELETTEPPNKIAVPRANNQSASGIQPKPESQWWKEDKSTNNSTTSESKISPKLAFVVAGLAIVGCAFGYVLWPSQIPDGQERIAQAARPDLSKEVSPPNEPVVGEPTAMDDMPNESNQEQLSGRGEQVEIATTSIHPNEDASFREPTKPDDVIPLNSVDKSTLQIENPAKVGVAVAAGSKEMMDTATPSPVGDKEFITVEQERSASAILEKKAFADKAYDLIDAKISFYKKTNDNIQSSRITWNEAKKKLEFIEARLKENRLAYSQAISRIAELNASLANPAGLVSQLQQKINQEKLERSQLTILSERLALDSDNKARQLQSEKLTMLESERTFVNTCLKEKESLDGMLQSIDFFQELPIEVHERIIEQAQKWTASEPDFFIAHLLHSTSAIWLQDYPIPTRNLIEMRQQAGLLSAVERGARAQALQRFETIAIGLVGVSEFKQKKTTDAIETLQAAFKLDQSFAEIWLIRGQVGLERKGQADGNYYFKRALALKREDPRFYRIALDSLLQQSEVSKNSLANLLHDLVKRAVYSDARSWITAADAAERIGELDNALEYLSRVDEPYLQERKKQILLRIEEAKGK